MRRNRVVQALTAAAVIAAAWAAIVTIVSAQAPLSIGSARVTIAGTSNIHPYTASTTKVRLTRAAVAGTGADDLWAEVLKPGVVQAFEVAIPAATLSSPREGLDKNMYKALKTDQFPDITFSLIRLEAIDAAAGTARAIGTLRITGVEKEVALAITAKRTGSMLTVQGSLDLLMTDYGIKPPTAMLGMLKTDPKVTVTFETVLAVPLT